MITEKHDVTDGSAVLTAAIAYLVCGLPVTRAGIQRHIDVCLTDNNQKAVTREQFDQKHFGSIAHETALPVAANAMLKNTNFTAC